MKKSILFCLITILFFSNFFASMISQAKRLDSLNGKNIALVGGSFMANTTHNELKK